MRKRVFGLALAIAAFGAVVWGRAAPPTSSVDPICTATWDVAIDQGAVELNHAPPIQDIVIALDLKVQDITRSTPNTTLSTAINSADVTTAATVFDGKDATDALRGREVLIEFQLDRISTYDDVNNGDATARAPILEFRLASACRWTIQMIV